MSHEMMKKSLESSLQFGSLSDLVKATEEVFLLIDTSLSMAGDPIVHLREVVSNIQKVGHVPMIAFGGPYDAQVRFVDVVPEPDGGTPLHLAIPLAKEYGAGRVVVISDGAPDLKQECLDQAKQFGGRIDVVFIGQPGDSGEKFLRELAALTGGTQMTGDIADIKLITSKVIGLLEGGVEPRGPIQGEGFSADEGIDPLDDDTDLEDDDDDEEEDDDEDE